MSNDDFLCRDLPVVNKRVHRLGLAFNYGVAPAGIEAAIEQGVHYLCGADSGEHMQENLRALEKGPLTPEEDEWMRRFGAVVHGRAVRPGLPGGDGI